MKPHPMIGKVLKYNGNEYLITQAPAELCATSHQVYSGNYLIVIVDQDAHYYQIAKPGEDYRPLTLKDLES